VTLDLVRSVRSSVRSLGHDAVPVALEVPVDRGLVEVHETIPIGATVELACEEHHVDVAAADPETLGRLRRCGSPPSCAAWSSVPNLRLVVVFE
jgi:hypothetical protein